MYRIALLAALLASGAFAGSFTVIDAFGLPKCPPGQTVGCDVVGPLTEFDFKRADFSFAATSATISLYFDFGPSGRNNTNALSPFAVTSKTTISVADLFIFSGGQIYAIPLFDRTTATWGSATAGQLYQANSPSALLTSDVVLNNPTDIYYRPGFPVWIDTTQASLAANGSITVSSGAAQGTTWLVTINLAYAAGSSVANALNASTVGIFTGTATCANDIVENPEPSTWTMLGAGAGLGVLAFRRRRRAAR